MSDETQKQNDDSQAVLAYRVGQLEEKVDHLADAVGSFNKWLIGVMGTLILALVLLVINLATHANNSISVTPH